VEQTRETYRIVKARARVGDASPSEVIEAESSMTRAEYEYQTSLFDYLMGLAKLEYAMGTSPESETNLRAKPRTVENSSANLPAGDAKTLLQEAIP
jgi:outer membrane protein TolC